MPSFESQDGGRLPNGGPPPGQPPVGPDGAPLVMNPPAAFPGSQEVLRAPRRGAFAMSETVPLIQEWAERMRTSREAWETARLDANEKKAYAKKVRADLIVRLRVFGHEATGGVQIKTSAERNEWADADATVQQAELEADLAQTVQMSAREAYEETARVFDTLRSMLAVERDDMKREHNAPGYGP